MHTPEHDILHLISIATPYALDPIPARSAYCHLQEAHMQEGAPHRPIHNRLNPHPGQPLHGNCDTQINQITGLFYPAAI
jgi:hypothetical protein